MFWGCERYRKLHRELPVTALNFVGSKRRKARAVYDEFDPQIEDLKRLSLDDKYAGGKGSMSEMVREALDDYLVKRRKKR